MTKKYVKNFIKTRKESEIAYQVKIRKPYDKKITYTLNYNKNEEEWEVIKKHYLTYDNLLIKTEIIPAYVYIEE